MAELEVRLAEAEAALATFEEAIGKSAQSVLERDGAILRLIYTFEALWKASQQLLAEYRRHQRRFAKRHDPRSATARLAVGRGRTSCLRHRE